MKILRSSLGDEHPIKRIVVVVGEAIQFPGVGEPQGKFGHTPSSDFVEEILRSVEISPTVS